MKYTLQLFAVILYISFLSSCGNSVESISEVELIPVGSGKSIQYINRKGEIVINPQFSEASAFREGLALVRTSGDERKWGFITEDGKFAITAKYEAATVFSEDLAWVLSENKIPTAINSKGEIITTIKDAKIVKIFKEGLSAFSIVDNDFDIFGSGKWGFVDKEGVIAINPQFSSTGYFSNGKCAVSNNDALWGYIDKKGKLLINYQFERASEFVDGRAIVASGGKYGVIDEKGNYLINPQYSEMYDDGGLYLIKQDSQWGWCDKEGKIIINPQFEQAFPFLGNDLAPVRSGKTWGYIDLGGKYVVNPQFDWAMSYNGKIALVLSGRKFGFIDESGKYVINPQFYYVSDDIKHFMFTGGSLFESIKK